MERKMDNEMTTGPTKGALCVKLPMVFEIVRGYKASSLDIMHTLAYPSTSGLPRKRQGRVPNHYVPRVSTVLHVSSRLILRDGAGEQAGRFVHPRPGFLRQLDRGHRSRGIAQTPD